MMKMEWGANNNFATIRCSYSWKKTKHPLCISFTDLLLLLLLLSLLLLLPPILFTSSPSAYPYPCLPLSPSPRPFPCLSSSLSCVFVSFLFTYTWTFTRGTCIHSSLRQGHRRPQRLHMSRGGSHSLDILHRLTHLWIHMQSTRAHLATSSSQSVTLSCLYASWCTCVRVSLCVSVSLVSLTWPHYTWPGTCTLSACPQVCGCPQPEDIISFLHWHLALPRAFAHAALHIFTCSHLPILHPPSFYSGVLTSWHFHIVKWLSFFIFLLWPVEGLTGANKSFSWEATCTEELVPGEEAINMWTGDEFIIVTSLIRAFEWAEASDEKEKREGAEARRRGRVKKRRRRGIERGREKTIIHLAHHPPNP